MKLNHSLLVQLFILLVMPSVTFCQSAPIDSAERENERLRWNEALLKDTAYYFKKEVNSWLAQAIKNRKPGRAVDVGIGQGRNAIYLAKTGWDVTGFDIADEALAYTKNEAERQHLKIKTVLQGSEEFDFGVNQWDLISFVYEGCLEEVPGLAARMKKGLKPGGIIVFEFFHRDAGIAFHRPDFGCPSNAEKDELLKVGGFQILQYEEKSGIADYGLQSTKLVYMIAEKK